MSMVPSVITRKACSRTILGGGILLSIPSASVGPALEVAGRWWNKKTAQRLSHTATEGQVGGDANGMSGWTAIQSQHVVARSRFPPVRRPGGGRSYGAAPRP